MSYTSLKPSGVEWIGDIPKHWDCKRVKYLISGITDGTHGTFDRVSDGLPLLSAKNVFDAYLKVTDAESLVSERDFKNIVSNGFPKKGDVLVSCVGTVGRTCVYELSEPMAFQRSVVFLRPKEGILSRMLMYCMMSSSSRIQEQLKIKQSAQPGIYQADIVDIVVPIAPFHEQQAIADFLDTETAKIDRATTLLHQQIDTLETAKKSVIHEAVTKGIDRTVSMKPSGLEWIGDIPEHWRTTRIKFIAPAWNGLTYDPSDISNDGIPILRSGNIQDGRLVLNDLIYISGQVPQKAMAQAGDILICSRNGSRNLIGKNTIIPENGYAFGAFMMIARPTVNPYYFHYLLNSGIFDYYLPTYLTSTVNQLTGTNFGNMVVPLVDSQTEQHSIVKYLDSVCTNIDEALGRKRKQLELLKQQRQSLIFEYVTGKRCVSEVR